MAIFDYWAMVETAATLMENVHRSSSYTNPSDDVFLWSLINPGHTGTAAVIEYEIETHFYRESGTAGDLAIKLQIKPSGGSWADVESMTLADPGVGNGVGGFLSGVYIASVLCPFELQIIGTDADATWRFGSPADYDYYGAYYQGSRVYAGGTKDQGQVRVYGTVT